MNIHLSQAKTSGTALQTVTMTARREELWRPSVDELTAVLCDVVPAAPITNSV